MKRVRRNRLWSFLLALCLVCNLFAEIPAAVAAESGSIPAQTISEKPAQITMSMAEDDTAGQTAMAFSWVITDTSVEQSELVYYKSDAPDDPVTVRAEMKVPDEADVKTDTEVEWGVFEPIHAFIAVAGGLTPGETYCYKVGNAEDGYSDIATFTAPADPDDEGAFSFVVSADTQSNTEAGYSNTKGLYDYIAEKESDAAFLIHTGDMVEDGNVSVQWEWFFEAAERLTSSMPMMTTPGNHEGGHHDRNLVNYKAHTNFDTLTAPEGLSEKTQGTIYSFEYGDALFVCLNTDAGSDDNRIQLQFLADQTARTDKTWKIVFMHVPPYDPGNNHYNINNTIGKYLSDAGVDLVLNGHEHVYARNTLLTTEAGFKEAEPGDAPTYVIGGSVMNAAYTRNSKSDLWSQVFVNLRKPSGSGIYAPGVYARVDVSGDSLTYNAYYKEDGENFSVIDTFTITKDSSDDGEPVEKAPLEIDSADDLVTLSKMDVSDRDIVLTKDIDMAGQTISPINGSLAYNGTFDGQGYVIKNLAISGSGNCTGLFGYVGQEGQIKNLGLENVTVSGSYNTGSLAGCLTGAVSGCYVTGEVTGGGNTGGIAGALHAGTIRDCWTNAEVQSENKGMVGGLFGTTAYSDKKDGTGNSPIANRITDTPHNVANTLVTGTVSGTTTIGGMVGNLSGGTYGSICGSFTGNVIWLDSVTATAESGVAGQTYGYLTGAANVTPQGACNNAYWDGILLSCKTSNDASKYGNFSSKTTEELKAQSTYEALGWDFDDTWSWDEELGHPILKQFAKPEAETVTIKTADDLVTLSERADVSNVNIRLANDVDMTGKTIAPIGGSIAYNGTFNGQGHVIKNLTISNADGNCTGLIGYVGSDGVVKNLALENVSITGGNSTGGVAGALLGTVSNCCVTGAISGAKNVGGIAGILHAGTIENCWTDATVTAENYGGGLFGTTDYRGTNGSEKNPSVLMNDLSGPITDRGHKIINNLVMGTTLGSTSAILGDWAGSKSSSGTGYTGNVLWLDSVATGKINGWTSDSAKLATQDHENVYCSDLTLAADSNSKTASLGNYTTRTAEELRAQETYAALGWDFENTWTWSDKLGHPVLKNITEPAAPVEPEPEEPGKFTSLVTTFAGDAKTTRAFTWHTDTTISASVVQAVEKANYTDETSFAGDHCIQVTGTSAELRTSAEGDKRNIHHANLTGLAAGTTYCYRVGDGDHTWSDVYTFTTEAENTEEFTFFHITDTQASSGNYRNYKSVLDTVSKTNPEGAFILHSGDVIQNNQTSHYDAVYETVAEYTSWLPSMVAPGNHEMEKDLDKATGGAYGVDNPNYVKGIENFKSRYLYPDNGPEKSKQLVYSFDYGNAHFAALNTNNPAGNAVKDLDDMATQIEWLKRDMNASDKTWKMVYVHVGPYNSYGDSLPALATALDELGVDVVFFGHNHIFMRSNAIEGGEIMELNMDGSGNAESGTVYYSSGSANSSGTINEKGKKWFAATQATSSSTYGVIRVTENTLTIDTYQLADTEPMDSFTIKKETASCSAAPIVRTGLTAAESAQELVTAGTAASGTMVYSLDGESWSESIPVAAEAGTYTVWYKVKGDATHNDSAAQSVSVTIAAAQGPDLPAEDGEIPRSVTYLWDTVSRENGTFSARFNWITDADETAPSYLFYAEKSAYDETGAYSQIAGTVTTVDLSDELAAKGYTGGTANYEGGDGAEYCYAPVKSYKAETPELKPNTEYVYRVGSGENGSTTEWKVIKTPAADTDTFDFLFFTDAQQGACGSYEKTLAAYDTLEKTLTQATTDYPDAAFIMSGGDQVNYGIDTWEWNAFFASNQNIFSQYPLYLSTGNHECDGAPDWSADDSWTPVDQTCSVVLGRYNPPENGVAYYGGGDSGTSPILTAGDAYEESKAGNYYFIYGDTLFLVMDFQDTSAAGLTEAQQEWVKAVVENNPTKWRVAVMHKTLFGYRVGDPTGGAWRSWSNTFDEADIDLVLMGHDHVYTRTKYYSDGAVTASQEDGSGTTYITGACANAGGRSDRYTANKYTLVNSTGSYGRSYVAVSISPKEIRVTAKGFDKDGQLITVENNALVTVTPRSVYAPASKVSLTAVSVTGAAKVGQTLTASPVPASATVAYQWERSANNSDWTAIDGAAALSYTITEADAGAYLRCTVTGTGDYQGTVSSTATEMIAMPVSGQKIRLSTVQEFEDFVVGFGGETYPADGNYELTASIDMTGKSLQPIGSSDIPFVGTFDGKGHTISNLTISSDAASVGLFAYVAEGGHVTNVMLENLSVSATAGSNTGAVAGACAGTIEQCSVTGSVTGNGTVGGLVGRLHGGTVKNCMVDVAVASSGIVAGGLVASTNYGGPITAKNEQTGNIVLNNLVLGTVNGTGSDYTGAVVGDMGGSKGAILKSFTGNVINAAVTADTSNRIAGYWSSGRPIVDADPVNYAVSSLTTDGIENSAARNAFTFKSDAELSQQTAYEALGWDFTNVWTWDDDVQHPALRTAEDDTDDNTGDDDDDTTGDDTVEPAKLIINQVYGDGGKEETPIANSFVELYNPNNEPVSLAGYTLTYGDETLTLDERKSIPANGSYLIVGAAADTTDEFKTYDLPEEDQTCDWSIDNKEYKIELKSGETTLDSVTAGSSDATKVSKQKSLQRVDHADTDTDSDFRIVVWAKGEMTADENTLSKYAPHNSEGAYGKLIAEEADESVTINTTSNTGLVKYLSSYSTGNTNRDGGVAEIVKFNKENNCMYLVSGQTQTLDIVKVKADGFTELVKQVKIASLGNTNGFSAGDITSVDVNTDCDLVAIAVQNAGYDKNGVIVTLDYEGNFVAKYDAGVQPDMITFTPDGSKILTANEGEPREGYGEGDTDPMGSVTVVDLPQNTSVTYNFASLDSTRADLLTNGVLLKKDTAPSADLEPEFIAVSADSKTAYVTLQENNAVAALDLTDGTWKYVKGLGFKDHSAEGNGLDLDQDGSIDIRNENVYGVYMPDGISAVTIGGQDYLITANEGDAREWGGYENIDSDNLVLADDEEAGKKIEFLDTAKTDGLDSGKTYILGGRSFSIWNAKTLAQVFDSGDGFERITAAEFHEYFNSGHDKAGLDERSHKKGVEPESVSVLETNGKIYAIVGLERMGGIMVYDISDPDKAVYTDYLNVRGFSETVKDLSKLGDLGPEGICTIPAEDSPTGNAMILVANEISGTVTVAQIEADDDNTGGEDDNDDSSGDDSPSSGGHSSHGGTSGTTSTTQKNPDGSTTTTTTNKITGTVTETIKTSDGVTGTTVTNKDGETTKVTVNIPSAAAKEAAKEGEVITVPVTVTAAEDTNDAVKMEMKIPASAGEVKVEIPVEEITSGTVAVIVNEDGTEEIVKTSVITENGVVLSIQGNTMVKIVDSSKEFMDVHPVDHWAEHAIDFVVARGIYSGTSETTFHPNNPMTRGMLAVVLYRLEDTPDHNYNGIFTDVVTGSYYKDGIYWAAENGIVGGYGNGLYGPDDNITREQLAVMLWRYAGSPESDHGVAHFTDANKISAYAQEAVEWASENGIINGKGGGILDPKGNATRAQVAQMLMNFVNNSK